MSQFHEEWRKTGHLVIIWLQMHGDVSLHKAPYFTAFYISDSESEHSDLIWQKCLSAAHISKFFCETDYRQKPVFFAVLSICAVALFAWVLGSAVLGWHSHDSSCLQCILILSVASLTTDWDTRFQLIALSSMRKCVWDEEDLAYSMFTWRAQDNSEKTK